MDHELEALLDLQPAAAAAEESDGYEPSVLDDSEKVPPDLDEEMPALRVVRAGGESLPTGTQCTDRGEIETGADWNPTHRLGGDQKGGYHIPEYVQEIRFQHMNLRKICCRNR